MWLRWVSRLRGHFEWEGSEVRGRGREEVRQRMETDREVK